MQNFSISRLHTSHGIFKLKGVLHFNTQAKAYIFVHQLQIMASDGWIELQIHHPHTQRLIKVLYNDLASHLDLNI
ncbi:hypothetical protein [Shewanella fidelis]|uniref:Uncharacterized protein n=1 Tax=Shewanella fidelis TaxID=173509 RepID=A0AAW8NRC2_9GAMM|nr:hypothetical protein [Shewanella fidelis]MDR8525331.1 hypothetical protein [Shewanella fidelis]MDW4813632.1 hypothetical protein [Shewanella fidelis]MDW4817710.1 hypothetical protein [Shewanella fidelis]MDW4821777.1 hypothetical protein [Shewanella fidelis]MDW4825960.1 hypothetical protein [Shewanella fidelis]